MGNAITLEPRAMRVRCLQLFILNIVDTAITLFAITQITPHCEGNVLMARAIAYSPWLFVEIKLALGSYLFWRLYNLRSPALRRYGSAVCLALYWGIVMQNCLGVAIVSGDIPI